MTRLERAAKAGNITLEQADAILKAAYPELHARTHFVCPSDIWLGIIERTNSGKRKDPLGEDKIMTMIWQPICDEFARMRQEYGDYDTHPPSPS
jgi:hypothetical protein